MPDGVVTTLDGTGFAVVDFVDPARRGPGLSRLLAVGGPATIDTLTRDGPRRMYRVPEGNAREAGLLDDPAPSPATMQRMGIAAKCQICGGTELTCQCPNEEWTRRQLDAYAAEAGLATREMPNKAAVLAAIEKLRQTVTPGDTPVEGTEQ